MTTFHILNGDCLLDQLLQTKINPNYIICRECLIVGNVNAKDLSSFWEIRANYIAEAYTCSPEDYYAKTVKEFEKIDQIPMDSEICLWFENDLFCQTNMWFVLSLLSNLTTARIFRIFPVIDNKSDTWKGFANATTTQLEKAFASKILFKEKDIQLGKNLWQAFQKNDFERLNTLSKTPSDCFEYLEEICQAHLDRFPEDGSLGRPERLIQQLLLTENNTFEKVFDQFAEREAIYGFGDLQIKTMYDKLSQNHNES